jgi:hypothetical protein
MYVANLAAGVYFLGVDNHSLNANGNIGGFSAGTDGSGSYQISVKQTTAVPEPSVAALLGLGFLGAGIARRRNSK